MLYSISSTKFISHVVKYLPYHQVRLEFRKDIRTDSRAPIATRFCIERAKINEKQALIDKS